MAKRIVTKIGDIFSVTLDNGNLRFFQYVANDLTNLNSSVIRVFKKEYPKGYELNPEEVVSDDVDFYAQYGTDTNEQYKDYFSFYERLEKFVEGYKE